MLKTLFDTAISQTSYYEKEYFSTDGTDYFLTINKSGLRSGKVWSPPEGSKMKKLVDVGYKLIGLAKSEDVVVTLDNEFRKEIEQLTIDLKQ